MVDTDDRSTQVCFMSWKLMFASVWLFAQLHAADQPDKTKIFEIRMVYDQSTPNTTELELTRKISARETSTQKLIVGNRALLDVNSVMSAKVIKDPNTKGPQISLKFNESGQKKFSKITRENVGRQLAIVINGKLIMAPRINEEISGGTAMIVGDFSETEAKETADRINNAANRK
jgi:preprotein translocase subunit SecD